MMIKRAAGTVLLVLATTGPAFAELTTKKVLELLDSDHPAGKLYLHGLSNGIEWGNADAEVKMYCPPKYLALTNEDYAMLLRSYTKGNDLLLGMPAGLSLIKALREMFPCKAS